MNNKPEAKVIGENANVFNILSISSLSMKEAGISKSIIDEMNSRVRKCNSYEEALIIMQEYVDFI